MTIEEAAQIIRKKWEMFGECDDCGWHASINEYEPLEEYLDQEDIEDGVVRLACHSKDVQAITGHDCLGDVTIELTGD